MQTELRLRELLAINRALTGPLEYDHVLEQIVKKTVAFTEADSCVLVLSDTQGQASVAASVGVNAEDVERFSAAFDERIGVALRELLGYRPEDVFLGSPIIDRGAITGILAVCRKDPQGGHPDDELMIGALADQAAIALIHAAHYRELRRELDTHQILTERIFSESPIGMLVLDPDLVVRDANPAAAQALERRRQELPGRSLSQLIGAGNAEHIGPLLRRAMAGETVAATAFPYQTADQRERFFETRYAPLPAPDNTARGILLLLWDVTERMRVEAELRAADRRKDEFLAMLAHELRNPLAPIRNAVEILRRDSLPRQIVDRTREMIESQVHHLVRLVDDLLDVSRVTAGKIQLRKESVALQTVIDNAVDNARPLLEARKHRVSVSMPPDPIHIEGDPTRLTQIFSNLLDNSAKYTEEGGTISVSVERQENAVTVTVRDNGIGIVPELLPHVFELFTQAQRTLDRAEGGLASA